jgi:beta-lactamase superfamily II metal-dependent hydrolase
MSHAVPLVTAPRGVPIYLQVISRSQQNRVTVGEEMSFTVTSRAPELPLLDWTMIDVGFGDSHLLTLPTAGYRVMIDSGEPEDWPNVDRYLKEKGISRIDRAVATHIHVDHIGGFTGRRDSDGVLRNYEIGRFLDSPDKSILDEDGDGNVCEDRPSWCAFYDVLHEEGIPVDTCRVGDTDADNPALAWDSGVRVKVFNSGHGRAAGGTDEGDWFNNDSIVFRISYGDVDLVLGGDTESPAERRILALFPALELESEVLKVHHHGHNDSSTSEFVTAVNPRAGMIPGSWYETGNFLPSSSVILRLDGAFADVYASDRAEQFGIGPLLDGSGLHVSLVTDGVSYEVHIEESNSTRGKPGVVHDCDK